jgi:hypothetical protein
MVTRMLIVDGVDTPAMLVVLLVAEAVPPSAAVVDVPHPVAGVMLVLALLAVLVTG